MTFHKFALIVAKLLHQPPPSGKSLWQATVEVKQNKMLSLQNNNIRQIFIITSLKKNR